jgi:hypothetical protein
MHTGGAAPTRALSLSLGMLWCGRPSRPT